MSINRLKKFVLSSVLFAVVQNSYASDDVWHTAHVERVYPQGDGRFVLTFTKNSDTCPNTSTPKFHYVAVGQKGVTQEGMNQMFSTALSAAVSGRELTIVYDPTTNYCYIDRLLIRFES